MDISLLGRENGIEKELRIAAERIRRKMKARMRYVLCIKTLSQLLFIVNSQVQLPSARLVTVPRMSKRRGTIDSSLHTRTREWSQV